MCDILRHLLLELKQKYDKSSPMMYANPSIILQSHLCIRLQQKASSRAYLTGHMWAVDGMSVQSWLMEAAALMPVYISGKHITTPHIWKAHFAAIYAHLVLGNAFQISPMAQIACKSL